MNFNSIKSEYKTISKTNSKKNLNYFDPFYRELEELKNLLFNHKEENYAYDWLTEWVSSQVEYHSNEKTPFKTLYFHYKQFVITRIEKLLSQTIDEKRPISDKDKVLRKNLIHFFEKKKNYQLFLDFLVHQKSENLIVSETAVAIILKFYFKGLKNQNISVKRLPQGKIYQAIRLKN